MYAKAETLLALRICRLINYSQYSSLNKNVYIFYLNIIDNYLFLTSFLSCIRNEMITEIFLV